MILFEFCLFVFSKAFPALVVVVDFFHKKKFCHYSLALFWGEEKEINEISVVLVFEPQPPAPRGGIARPLYAM